jgi:hypothetical protein
MFNGRQVNLSPRRFPMRMCVRNLIVATSISAGVSLAIAEAGEVSFLSGGVGQSSQQELLAVQQDYSLKLVFAQDSGAFLANVDVRITATDGTELLTTTALGPWLLVDLPAGEYRVTAGYRGVRQEATVQVPESGLKELTMRWQSATADD